MENAIERTATSATSAAATAQPEGTASKRWNKCHFITLCLLKSVWWCA